MHAYTGAQLDAAPGVATLPGVQQGPPSWATPSPSPERREGRLFLGCIGAGCLAFAAIVALISFIAFLDHYGFINDNLIKTVRRCRTFGC